MRAKWKKLIEGNDGWTEWRDCVDGKHRIACCDCGLTHDFQFRIKGKIIQFRATRNMRSTAAKRHAQKNLSDKTKSKLAKIEAGLAITQKSLDTQR